MTAGLDALDGPRLVLLAGGSIDLAGLPCALCGVPVLPGRFLAALAYSDARAGFACPRCSRDVDAVVAELAQALNLIDALISDLSDRQNRSGLAHGLDLLVHKLTDPKIEGEPVCPSFPAGTVPPDPSTSSPNP